MMGGLPGFYFPPGRFGTAVCVGPEVRGGA